MDLLAAITPPHPVMAPVLYTLLFYGLRYFLFAGLSFLVAHPAHARGVGRAHAAVPASFDTALHVRRELFYSVLTVGVFAGVNAVLYGYGFIHASLIYYQFVAYPAWWFVLSIVLMLVLHDTLFYWLHRAMHTPRLYRATHDVHHRSIYPTAFAAYSFHPWEALGEALIVTVIIYVMPVHPLAFLIFQTISTAYNVYGHCGRELYPRGMHAHWLGRWINTSTLHAGHHLNRRGNYGLYFTFWDRAMGTLVPPGGRA